LKYRFLYYLAIAFLASILVSFLFRTPVVSWLVKSRIAQFNRQYNAELDMDEIRVIGMASIRATGITLRPAGGDTLLHVDTVFASAGILKLFAGRLSIHKVELRNTEIFIREKGGKDNFMFLLRRHEPRQDTVEQERSYARTAERMMRLVSDKIPVSLLVSNFNIVHSKDDHQVSLHVDRIHIDNHYFRTLMELEEDSLKQQWVIAGRTDQTNRSAEFRIFAGNDMKPQIPYMRKIWGAGIAFDTLAFRLAETGNEEDREKIGGFALVRGLEIDHRMVARQPVVFDQLSVDYLVNIGTDYAEIDSATRVVFNRIDFHPYVKYRPHPTQQITISIHKPSFLAQDLFSSFPPGLFSTLDGIKVSGRLSWDFDFDIDLSLPDSLTFYTSLNRHQFRLLSFGNTVFTAVNAPFEFTAYEHDLPVKSFVVGPENPDFRSLDKIPSILPCAVMTSEDGAFYLHRGFLPDAFRESMIQNIKERRFARGGSTISMQLVKNLFLSRNKTIARKLEEALIVWLIENNNLITKERMMELYLNIIEWGPLIYGANEASRFYFSKDVSRISLAEAIFMASIIPRPKSFRYQFDDQGHLRESAKDFFILVAGKMAGKGWITAGDAEKLVPEITLKGPARNMLKSNDTIPGWEQ
jgi:hypothetical protein